MHQHYFLWLKYTPPNLCPNCWLLRCCQLASSVVILIEDNALHDTPAVDCCIQQCPLLLLSYYLCHRLSHLNSHCHSCHCCCCCRCYCHCCCHRHCYHHHHCYYHCHCHCHCYCCCPPPSPPFCCRCHRHNHPHVPLLLSCNHHIWLRVVSLLSIANTVQCHHQLSPLNANTQCCPSPPSSPWFNCCVCTSLLLVFVLHHCH